MELLYAILCSGGRRFWSFTAVVERKCWQLIMRMRLLLHCLTQSSKYKLCCACNACA